MTGMRLAKTLALTALVMITVPVLSPAQTPADPLVRPDETPGKYELTLGLAYVPGGEEGLALSEHGPVVYTNLQHQVVVPLGLQYFASPSSSIVLTLTPRIVHTIRAEMASGAATTSSQTETSIGGSVGLRRRLAPLHAWDPTLALSLDLPFRTAQLALSVSWLRDPVVLSGSLSYKVAIQPRAHHVAVDLGAGLFLNDKIRARVSAQQSVRLDEPALPRWNWSSGIVYSLDGRGISDLYVGLQRAEQGGKAVTGLVLEWYRLVGGQ